MVQESLSQSKEPPDKVAETGKILSIRETPLDLGPLFAIYIAQLNEGQSYTQACRAWSVTRCSLSTHAQHSNLNALSCRTGIQVGLPYLIAVYMVRDWLGSEASEEKASRMTGLLVRPLLAL